MQLYPPRVTVVKNATKLGECIVEGHEPALRRATGAQLADEQRNAGGIGVYRCCGNEEGSQVVHGGDAMFQLSCEARFLHEGCGTQHETARLKICIFSGTNGAGDESCIYKQGG